MSATTTNEIDTTADIGMVVSVRVADRHTDLDYLVPHGIDTVRLAVVPDQAAARRLAETCRRLCWVAIHVDDDGFATAELSAIGHRMPIRRDIRLATALGLTTAQVATVIRHQPVVK